MGEPKKKPGRSRKNGTDWELRRYVMLLAAVIVLILIGSVAMFSGKITNILGKKDGLPAEMVDTGGSGMVIEPDTKEYIQDFGGCILTENGEPGITELMNTYFQVWMTSPDTILSDLAQRFINRKVFKSIIFSKENEKNLEWFLAQHPDFTAEDITEYLPQHWETETAKKGYLTLLPHKTGTDGFFISKMRRKN